MSRAARQRRYDLAMFIGHFAAGYASKRFAPKASLGILVAAPLLLDLLWPVFCLAGIESFRIVPGDTAFTPLAFDHYPWSHSALMTLAWAALFGGLVRAATRDARAGIVAGIGVASHWVFDAVVHRADLPLMPFGETKVGLGLWSSEPVTIALELTLFAGGLLLYARATRPRDGVGRWALVTQVALLLVIYAANAASPPPPSTAAVTYSALALGIFVPWAAWIDRHRELRAP